MNYSKRPVRKLNNLLAKPILATSSVLVILSMPVVTSFAYSKEDIHSEENTSCEELKGTDFIIDYNYIDNNKIIPVAPYDVADIDPLSNDILGSEYENNLDMLPMDINTLMDRYSKYFDHPGTPFLLRQKRIISPDDYQYVENVVLGEVSYCSFEQMVAEASLCINIMEQEDANMYDLVMRPGVFSPDYAEKTRESTEEVTAAIEAAVFGLDFSCGATAACTYEWMDDYDKKWFDTLYLTNKIEDSSFYCAPEKIFTDEIYSYSDAGLEKVTVEN